MYADACRIQLHERPPMTFTPTAEQDAILAAFTDGKDLVIQAGAGTGKTTTLKLLANSTPRYGTYLAFNKAIQVSAAQSMPPTVRCKTAHGLAWQEFGNRYSARMNAERPSWATVIDFLNAGPLTVPGTDGKRRSLTAYQTARLVLDTVKGYCQTSDADITAAHIPPVPGVAGPGDRAFNVRTQRNETDLLADYVLPRARKAWADIQNTEGVLSYDHSYYLKAWALTNPIIGGDYLAFDEAQDANGAIAGVVNAQTHLQRIFVGDSSQQIYCQPVGTLVDVPVGPTEVPVGQRCAFDDCGRLRSHKATGLCHPHQLQWREGRPLAALGARQGRSTQVEQVPIETLSVGDHVVTYDNAQVFVLGRPVTNVRRFEYNGDLVRVRTDTGLSSAYTPEHHCVVRISAAMRDREVVYLMRKGRQFRIGRVPMVYGTDRAVFGPVARAQQEGADALWVLSTHASKVESSLAEALAQHRFNIPGVRFRSTTDRDVLNVHSFWSEVGDNEIEAERCLNAHGRLIEFPLWSGGRNAVMGLNRPFVTSASNLVSGMLVLPSGARKHWKGKRSWSAPIDQWVPIEVSREAYAGDIVSLEVADHHTYYGDGILTHNSFAGATNAMRKFARRDGVVTLSLTESFRFGPKVATAANGLLDRLNAPLRIAGTPLLDSIVATLDGPGTPASDAILCRTNAGALDEVIKAQSAGKKVCLLGNADELRRFVEAAKELQDTGKTNFHALMAFESWAEVQDFVEQDPTGADLTTMVDLVDTYGAATLLGALRACVREHSADVTVSTAHKAKGCEWDNVRISADFDLTDDAHPEVLKAELMLAYVAVTRARLRVDPGLLAPWIGQEADTPTTASAPGTLPQVPTNPGVTPSEPAVLNSTDTPPVPAPASLRTLNLVLDTDTLDALDEAADRFDLSAEEFAQRLLTGALTSLLT